MNEEITLQNSFFAPPQKSSQFSYLRWESAGFAIKNNFGNNHFEMTISHKNIILPLYLTSEKQLCFYWSHHYTAFISSFRCFRSRLVAKCLSCLLSRLWAVTLNATQKIVLYHLTQRTSDWTWRQMLLKYSNC